MFATLSGGYPREPLVAQPDRLGDADRSVADGEMTPAEHTEIVLDMVHEVLREQEISGLSILTDGGIRHADRLAPIVAALGGHMTSSRVLLPDGDEAQRPGFDAGVNWRGPILAHEWTQADGMTDFLVKQVLIGPYTIARLADPPGAARADLALALAEALNGELKALASAGCPIIQIEEGSVNTIGDDSHEWNLFAETQRRLTAGLETAHLTLSLCGGGVHPAGYEAVLGGPFLSYLVDALGGPDAWRFAFQVPVQLGLIIGAVDAAAPVRDEAEVMVWAMAWAAEGGRGSERVGLAPNGSLNAVGRHMARRKIERMGEAADIAVMGPLNEVAEALDPAPLQSRMEPLRQMAEAVTAARTSLRADVRA